MGFFQQNEKIAVAFCSPHRMIKLPNGKMVVDNVCVEWHRKRTGLALGTNINFCEFHIDGLEVGVARDLAARKCLSHRPQPEYLFFLDDDVLPLYDAFIKLFYRLQSNPGYDIAAGVYSCKGIRDPLIYAGDGCGPFWDWAVGDLLTTEQHGITGTHMGLTLIRTSLFQRMLDAGVVDDEKPFFHTTHEQAQQTTRSGTEDLYFYKLAAQVGVKIIVDTSVLAGHYDKNTGITWGLDDECPPVQRAKWMKNRDREEAGEAKLALDIGAGGTRREWPGHKTYTTDIRADSKPDYVQDTRLLNLPENHFDLVASSHHLEHIGRWEQEQVWQQMFKVCKPGGRIEHIVPSIEWAAAKIADGQCDEHVMNVLYGAQEAHGYQREYNLHYFGYTKEIAKALAEAAGFTDVACEDWRDRPELGYNLIIRGAKPLPVAKFAEEPNAAAEIVTTSLPPETKESPCHSTPTAI